MARSWIVLVLFVLASCKRETTEAIRADPKTNPSPSPPPTHEVPPNPTRIRGPIDGRFTLAKTAFVSGEPILAKFEVKNLGSTPLQFQIGGDYRGSPWWHLRFGMIVKRDGKVLCDTIANAPISMGGLGTTVLLREGSTHTDSLLLGGVCEALNEPGRYRVMLQRRLVLETTTDAGTGKPPLSCDEYNSLPDPIPGDAGLPSSCIKSLEASPFVASELELDVVPYDGAKIAKVIDGLATAGDREWPMHWFCETVHCACPKKTSPFHDDPTWIRSVAKSVPLTPHKAFPRRCGATGDAGGI